MSSRSKAKATKPSETKAKATKGKRYLSEALTVFLADLLIKQKAERGALLVSDKVRADSDALLASVEVKVNADPQLKAKSDKLQREARAAIKRAGYCKPKPLPYNGLTGKGSTAGKHD